MRDGLSRQLARDRAKEVLGYHSPHSSRPVVMESLAIRLIICQGNDSNSTVWAFKESRCQRFIPMCAGAGLLNVGLIEEGETVQ